MKPLSPTFRSRLLATVRVLSLLAVFLGVSLVVAFRAGQARAGDVLVQLGAQLMQLPDAYHSSAVQQLLVNGIALKLQTGASERSPEEVVQQFYDACKARSAMQLDPAQREHLEPVASHSTWLQHAMDGVLVREGRDGTSIVCIDAQGKPWDLLSIAEAMQQFVASGDLAELGVLRYAWVRPAQRGSVFLTLWTDGPARLLEQFPRHGDAPGGDFPDVERIAGSQRFLSASLGESVLTIYRHARGGLNELAASYATALEGGGYRATTKPMRGDDNYSAAYEKGRRHVVLLLKAAADDSIMVTLLSQP